MSRMPVRSWIIGGALLQLSCASHPEIRKDVAETPAAQGAGPSQAVLPPGIQLLSTVVNQELTGLDAEPESEREELVTQARNFVRFRMGRMTLQEKSLRKRACSEFDIAPEFCEDILGSSRSDHGHGRTRDRSRVGRGALIFALTHGRIQSLRNVGENQLNGALKRIGNPRSLAKLLAAMDAAMNEGDGCLPSPLLSAVGLRMEEEFPEQKYHDLALAFYSRADRCGNDFSTLRARYRLALLHILDRKFESAEVLLKQVSDSPDNLDFRSRSYYWRHECAKMAGKPELQEEMKSRLLKEFPFSLHALLLSGIEGPSLAVSASSRDPHIRFRSILKPDLNRLVRTVEAVQSGGGLEASLPLIEEVLEGLVQAEPEFQLYVAVLLRRSGDVIRKFQLLTVLLREHPDLISKTSLEMLYPLKQFELVRSHTAQTDPYLVLSLIRQESAFNERARSPAGAMGLMQLMPSTARRMERISRKQLFDPQVNVRLGVRFFSHLLDRYSGDVELALAAYNAGPDRVDEWMRRYPFVENPMLFVDLIPFKETREYVASIARNYFWYLKLYEQQSPGARALESSNASFALFRLKPLTQ